MPNPPHGYEWDERKAAWNLATHGISFAEADKFDDATALELEGSNDEMKKTAPRYSARSAGKSASSHGVRKRSELSAFERQPPRKGGSTSKRKVIDPDNPPLTDEQLKRMRPISKETLDFINRARGRPPIDNPKQAVSLRLDPDVIEHFKKSGPGWQSRINAALRKHAKLKP